MDDFDICLELLKEASGWSATKAKRRAEKRKERRAKFWELLGGKCSNCSSTQDLEFDHLDPSSKVLTISKRIDLSDNNLLAEVKKCQLLCKKCHHKKTLERGQYHPIVIRDL